MRRKADATLSRRTVYLGILLLLALLATNIVVLNTESAVSILYAEWLPSSSGRSEQRFGKHVWRKSREPASAKAVEDEHPIRGLMHEADRKFKGYEADRSLTFNDAVKKYRRKYGRHPPPGFKEVCTVC